MVVVGQQRLGQVHPAQQHRRAPSFDRCGRALGGRDVTAWPEWRRAACRDAYSRIRCAVAFRHLTLAENLAVASKRGSAPGSCGMRSAGSGCASWPSGSESSVSDSRTGSIPRSARCRAASGRRSRSSWRPGPPQRAPARRAYLRARPGQHRAGRSADRADHPQGRMTTLMVTHSIQQAVALGDRVLIMHRGRIAENIGGARKRQLRVEELLDTFERLRNADRGRVRRRDGAPALHWTSATVAQTWSLHRCPGGNRRCRRRSLAAVWSPAPAGRRSGPADACSSRPSCATSTPARRSSS